MQYIDMRKIGFIGFIAVILLLACSYGAIAGGEDRAGTSAAPELMIPVGARYVGMGGAPVAFASGVEAIFWNPAGVDRVTRSANAMFSYRSYIADISLDYLAVTGKFDFGSIGLSLRSLNIGDIPVTTTDAPDGTGEIFNPTYFVMGLTYSRQVTDRIAVGATVNLIQESFAKVNSTGMSVDAGVQYHGAIGIPNFDIGVALKNIGPSMQFGGPGLWTQAVASGSQRGTTYYKVEASSFDLPTVVEIGLGYKLLAQDQNVVDISATFQNNNYAYDEYRVGAEYSYDQKFFLRAGYLMAANSTDNSPDIFQKFSVGVGVNFVDVGGTDISFDYAFVPVQYFSNNHLISLKVGF